MREVVCRLQGVSGLGEGLGEVAFESVPIAMLPEKRVDMHVPGQQLSIEADERQHFYDSHHGKPARQQYDRDRAFDDVCEAAGCRLVRLHYKDRDEWAGLVRQALAHPRGRAPFVFYTSSYKHEADRRAKGLL
jgi:hypothetical protein